MFTVLSSGCVNQVKCSAEPELRRFGNVIELVLQPLNRHVTQDERNLTTADCEFIKKLTQKSPAAFISRNKPKILFLCRAQVALPYYLKRDYVRALELLRQANELGPPFSATWEIGVYVQNRLYNEALAELEKSKRERKGDLILISSTGIVYAVQGKRAEALQTIKELEEVSGASLYEAHWIAKIYAALNEKEQALAWLERGLTAGAIGPFYKDEPVWDPLRSEPRFAGLLRRMGISQ